MNPTPVGAPSHLIVGTMRWTIWGANMTVEQAEAFMRYSISVGLTTFDTADIYGLYTVETLIGEVLKRNPDMRAQIKIITKCGIKLPCDLRPLNQSKCYDSSINHILASVSNSLQQLGVEYIDQLLIHRPDPLTGPQEVAEAFKVLHAAGHVRSFGVSNYTQSQFRALANALQAHAPHITLATNQVELSPFNVNSMFDGTMDVLIEMGVRPQIWSPFGGGRIFDGNSQDAQVLRVRAAVLPLAQKYSVSVEAILLAWISKHPSNPEIVVGTTKAANLAQCIGGMPFTLDRDEWFKILEAGRGFEIP